MIVWRSFRFYWRSALAVTLSVALASAVIIGSLAVGDSVRGALRDLFVGRLGPWRNGVQAQVGALSEIPAGAMGVLHVRGSAQSEDGLSAKQVSVFGVTEGFGVAVPADGEATITPRLAHLLDARPGSRLFLKVGKPQAAPLSSLFAHRDLDGATVEVPVTVAKVVSDRGVGGFSLRPTYGSALNAFVSQKWLSRQVGCGPNLALAAHRIELPATMANLGLTALQVGDSVVVRSKGFGIPDRVMRASPGAAKVSVALAESVKSQTKQVAYAMVASSDVPKGMVDINAWCASDLGVRAGDAVGCALLVPVATGGMDRIRTQLRVRRVLPMVGLGASAELVPNLEGLTDADRMSDWHPPFEVDLGRVTPRDEAYWKQYRAAPRLFVSQELVAQAWSGKPTTTALVFRGTTVKSVTQHLTSTLSPEQTSVTSLDLMSDAEQAAVGSSDLGSLTLMLGSVLVVAGLLLAGGVVGLAVQSRRDQFALMDALGISGKTIRRLALLEQMWAVSVGTLLGLPLGIVFAWVALRTLTTAMPNHELMASATIRLTVGGLLVGLAGSWLVALFSAWLAVKRSLRLGKAAHQLRPVTPKPVSLWRVVTRSIQAKPWRFGLQAFVSFASAFVMTAVVGNLRATPVEDPSGINLMVTTSVPVALDFGTAAGRQKLGFDPDHEALWDGVQVFRLMRSGGDDVSCLNPGQPTKPRVAAAPEELLKLEPYGLKTDALSQPNSAAGDSESVEWVLHSAVGKNVSSAVGEVRVAALTHGSPLADTLLVSESTYRSLSPGDDAPSLFLFRVPKEHLADFEAAVRGDLASAGPQVERTSDVVEALHGVQNGYMAMFACLGFVGLLLGVLGVAVLTLRSAAERRGEMALELALGFTRGRVGTLLVGETLLAVCAGLLFGTIAALGSVCTRPFGEVAPWVLGGMLGTLAVTITAGWVAAIRSLKSGVLEALRTE